MVMKLSFPIVKSLMQAISVRTNQIMSLGINIYCGYYSYAEVPKKENYNAVLGVTGTLESLHEESLKIVKQYVQLRSAVPSMFGESKRQLETKIKDYLLNLMMIISSYK